MTNYMASVTDGGGRGDADLVVDAAVRIYKGVARGRSRSGPDLWRRVDCRLDLENDHGGYGVARTEKQSVADLFGDGGRLLWEMLMTMKPG